MTQSEQSEGVAPQQVSRDLSRFNIIAALVLLASGLLALFYLIPTHVMVREGLDQGLSPRFMPRFSASAIMVLSLILLLGVLWRRVKGLGAIVEDNEDNESLGIGVHELKNAGLLVVGSAAYTALLYLGGFLIATGLTLAVCFWAGGIRNPLWLALVCLALPFALEQALWRALYVILPTGIF
ncbi:MAG: tripartite tricarboxylate transporter TctB family protein [Albidovulum sp.]